MLAFSCKYNQIRIHVGSVAPAGVETVLKRLKWRKMTSCIGVKEEVSKEDLEA